MKRTEEEKEKKSQERIDAKREREERRSQTEIGRAVNEDLAATGLDSASAQKRNDKKFGASNPIDKKPADPAILTGAPINPVEVVETHEPVIHTGNPEEGDGGTAKIGDKNSLEGGAPENSPKQNPENGNIVPQEGNGGAQPADNGDAPVTAPQGGVENPVPVEGAAPQDAVKTPPAGNGDLKKPEVAMPDVSKGDGQEESVTGKNSASNSATTSTTTSTENGTIEKKKVLNDLGKEAQARYDERIAEKQAEVADARSSYAVKTPEQARQEVMNDPAFKDKKEKRIAKEVNRRVAASRDEVYRMLDPNYKTEKQVKRNELAKLLIGGFADLFATGMAAGAAFNGVRYPLKSMTAGIQADIDEKDAQRRALTAALEKMRQGKIDLPQKELADLMNGKDKTLQTPAYYDEVQTIDKNKGSQTYGKTNTQRAELDKTVKDPKEGGGKEEGNGRKTENNEYTVHVPGQNYTYSMLPGPAKTFFNGVFNRFKKVSGVKDLKELSTKNKNKSKSDQEEKDIKTIWALMHDLQQSIQGTDDASTKQSYQQKISGLLTNIYEYFLSNPNVKKEDIDELNAFIDGYGNNSGVWKIDERGGGNRENSGGQQQGSDEVPDWILNSLN